MKNSHQNFPDIMTRLPEGLDVLDLYNFKDELTEHQKAAIGKFHSAYAPHARGPHLTRCVCLVRRDPFLVCAMLWSNADLGAPSPYDETYIFARAGYAESNLEIILLGHYVQMLAYLCEKKKAENSSPPPIEEPPALFVRHQFSPKRGWVQKDSCALCNNPMSHDLHR